MKVKEGVDLRDLNIIMRPVLVLAARIYEENGQELVITSTGEGVHSPGSLHYYGYAVDLRTHYFDVPTQNRVFEALTVALPEYQVLLKDTHIHIEYDKAKQWN